MYPAGSKAGRWGPATWKRTLVRRLVVSPSWYNRSKGRLRVGPIVMSCALGRAGVFSTKREGDGATPAGEFRLLKGFMRRDQVRVNSCSTFANPLRPSDGWCDDPRSGAYNLSVQLPFRASHERMWRNDHLYDVVIILDHNRRPRRRNGGSAIFFHLADDAYNATAGCVAISLRDMRRLLPRLAPSAMLRVLLPGGQNPRPKNR